MKKYDTRKKRGPKFTKEECFCIITEKQKMLGRRPNLSEFDNAEEYAIRMHFGTYNMALEACGITPKIRDRRHLTKEMLIKSLTDFYQKYGIRPSCATTKYKGELYTSEIYRGVLGCKTWNEVLIMAGLPRSRKLTSDDPEEIVRFTKQFITDNDIKSFKQLFKHESYSSEDFIIKRFGSLPKFSSLIGLEIQSQNEECPLSDGNLLELYKKISRSVFATNGATIEVLNLYSPWPSHVFTKRFGSMRRLRLLSGYAPMSESRYSETQIMGYLTDKTREVGCVLTRVEVDRDPNGPHSTTCEGVTGKKFAELKEIAFQRVQAEIKT